MRRGFGRPLRRAFAPDIPPLLRRANQMLSAGNYAEAATAYEQLARAAEARGGPRAPLFYVQAGRANVMAGQTANGLEYMQRGLGLFAMRGQQFRAYSVATRLIRELNGRSLKKEAQGLTDYLNELLPDMRSDPAEAAPGKRASLPTHCPGCGAPLRPDEVDWMDDATAACAYCGSPVRGDT